MSDDRWQKMAALFQEALDLVPQEVDSFLRQSCGDDSQLERAVRALLEANGEAGDFMEEPYFRGSVSRISKLAARKPDRHR